jgi:hypothetical protein
LPLTVLAAGHFQAQRTFIDLLQKYAGDPAVDMKVVDNSGPTARVVEQPLSFLQNERIFYRDQNEVEQRARQAFEGQAHRLTDPDAISNFREGKTVAKLAADLRQNVAGGERSVGSADGTDQPRQSSASGADASGSPDAADQPVTGESDQVPLFGGEVADHPSVERPLADYIDALRQGELNLGQPVDFAREFQTDMGQRTPAPLIAKAKELEVQPGEADQNPSFTRIDFCAGSRMLGYAHLRCIAVGYRSF